MAKVMTRCPETNEEVYTGIEVTDIATFRRTEYDDEARKFTCPACGHVHQWETPETYLKTGTQQPGRRI